MAKASDIPLLKQEKTLLKEIAQLKKDGAKASKTDAAVMKKRAEDAQEELERHIFGPKGNSGKRASDYISMEISSSDFS